MRWKRFIRESLFYGGLHKEDFEQVRESVLEHNRSSAVSWSLVAGGFWIYSLIMSLSDPAYANCRVAYALGLICCIITLIGSFFFAPRFRKLRFPLILLFDFGFLSASIGIAVFQPDVRSITMFVAVIIVPICFIERSALMMVLLPLNLAAYIIFGRARIQPDVYYWGLGNLIIFSIAGFLVGHVINRSRFERYVYAESVRKLSKLEIEKEAADRANAAKSDFLANMSHEIRTPINAMLGMNEMILRESSASGMPEKAANQALSRVYDYSRNIGSAGHSLLSIVNDILDFSRIESGKMRITVHEYSLSSVLNDVCSMCALRAAEKKLDFDVRVDSSLPDRLRGDDIRLRQILSNLLGNAFKYTSKGSIILSVGQAADSGTPQEGTIRLSIAVEDTGIGIREEDMDRLFNKFERVNLKMNSTVEGAGLGLAITHNLLEMMGGSIRVESTYGIGSVFRAELPQKVVSDAPIGEFHWQIFDSAADPRTALHASFRAPEARILIVDDTRINRMVTEGLLKETDIRMDTAACGPDAIRLAEETLYDLILMDQRMPEMDGVEALRRIRQGKGPNTQTPVICLTADAVNGAREHYISEGFTDYLSKPLNGEALEKAVMQYLPAEKILPAEKREEKENASEEDGEYADLQAAGIQAAEGLANSQGSHDLYGELLREFARDAEEKGESLERCYETQDWRNYTVYVHALKSSARLIGAMDLSAMALELEQAGKTENATVIRSGHPAMMDEYRRIAGVVRAWSGGTDDGDDAEILDFPVAGN